MNDTSFINNLGSVLKPTSLYASEALGERGTPADSVATQTGKAGGMSDFIAPLLIVGALWLLSAKG